MTQIETERSISGSQVALNPNKKPKKTFCKRLAKFLFSHVGLVGMVVIYAVLGGLLFELLEQHEEIRMCEEGRGIENIYIVTLRSKLLTYIQFNITSNPSENDKDNETVANQNIELWLQDFRSKVHDLKVTYRYTGNNCNNPKWNFPGALLFAVTAITTIGYGHIAPVTWEGQIVCVCYAIIGIPIFLMCIANISGVLGDMFRFIYSRICCRICYNKQKRRSQKDQPEIMQNNLDIMNTTGVDTVVDYNGDHRVSNFRVGGPANNFHDHRNDQRGVIIDEEVIDEDDMDKVNVPLTITIIIITGYIAIGAVLFHKFEDWSMIQSAYFCFITLATIGFGDFVPGQRENDVYAGPKLVLGAIYVLFGMSIVGMCFDLMQEEIIAKFTWLGKKLGIVDQDEEQGDEQQNEYANEQSNNVCKPINFTRNSSKDRLNNLDQNKKQNEIDMISTADVIRGSRSAYLENVLLRQLKS